jgi:chemosensory pili system protein ChpA (sensor histidine kinase/response regulator)
LARGSDLAALDASQLRIARQQLHQAVGALEMVGMAAPAKILRSMEALAQRFVQRPELCSDEAANKVERASFALTEYLEGVLKGKSASSVALFPQYRDVLELVGNDRVHPADLWPLELRWIDVVLPQAAQALAYDSSVRTRLDRAVLEIVKSGDVAAAQLMCGLGFAAAQTELEARVFWKISAAYFEAVSLGLCPTDVYGKLAASRILLQFRTLARGEPGISERLVQDLLFFCAQAVPMLAADAPVLAAVRAAYGLTQTKSFDYERPQFGRFDRRCWFRPASVLRLSLKPGLRSPEVITTAKESSLVTDSVLKMHPERGLGAGLDGGD